MRIHVGSVFYSSIKPYLARHHYVNSIQVVGKNAIVLIVVLFFFTEYIPKSMHQTAQIKLENCKVFIASEGVGVYGPQTDTSFQTRKICKVR